MTILAIDPGPKLSAFVLVDGDLMPETATKVDNHTLLGQLRTMQDLPDVVAIEMIASYGMPVGAETFDTCVWIGRYLETLESAGCAVHLIPRLAVRLHLCHSIKAKDTNVIQALVDRFAKGQPNRGKGTKDNPGWFHGFAGDTWQAYALAVYAADKGL